MNCRQCGTEISDKALICYQCGAPTDEPAAGPARARRRAFDLPLAVLIVLALAGAYLGQVVTGEVPRWASWAVAGLAAVLAIWRLARRGAT